MTKTSYYSIWAGMFILCAGLGFIPEPAGLGKWLLVALSVAFFLPPFLLVRQAAREKDRATLTLVRNLSLLSLCLTVVTLIGNFLCVMASDAVGNAMYALLVILSTPMICGQYWLLSLFLWAFLLLFCVQKLRRRKK